MQLLFVCSDLISSRSFSSAAATAAAAAAASDAVGVRKERKDQMIQIDDGI
jgi:hypothetical protein